LHDDKSLLVRLNTAVPREAVALLDRLEGWFDRIVDNVKSSGKGSVDAAAAAVRRHQLLPLRLQT